MKIPFDNSYANLPTDFYTKINPTPVKDPSLILFNETLANELGIVNSTHEDKTEKLTQIFSGNKIPHGAEPLAMVYAGHQFGGFSHQLGDGRAILLGEVLLKNKKNTEEKNADILDSLNTLNTSNTRYDLQLKGSGPTPYSRSGDGRSALGPVIREYLVSEAMAKLGVPTTRALAAVTTGEEVARNSLVPGGILTRVAKGFVRVGTFQYFSSQKNITALKQLTDYEIERHYPKAKDTKNPYATFLAEVVNAQAKLIAQWMQFGFIHGVMNTDNMSIAGETIDYGPCAFMDEFEHDRVYSSIDHQKRYAYNNQPNIGQWNLIRLAETLLPLLINETNPDEKQAEAAVKIAQDILNNYQEQYQAYWLSGMRKKLGLFQAKDDDTTLINELLTCMEENKADFTLSFYYLSCLGTQQGNQVGSQADNQECNPKTEANNKIQALFNNTKELDSWLKKWRDRLTTETLSEKERQLKMLSINPLYIPRNHLIESAIRAAEEQNDFSVFHELHEVLKTPFKSQKGKESYTQPPKPEEVVHQTFCGT